VLRQKLLKISFLIFEIKKAGRRSAHQSPASLLDRVRKAGECLSFEMGDGRMSLEFQLCTDRTLFKK
jgi:hypothetical protein